MDPITEGESRSHPVAQTPEGAFGNTISWRNDKIIRISEGFKKSHLVNQASEVSVSFAPSP